MDESIHVDSAEKCTKPEVGISYNDLKYTGSSKKILHQHWVERDGLDLFDDTSRIRSYGMEVYVLELKNGVVKILELRWKTFDNEDWMRMCPTALEYKCESHNLSRIYL